MNDSKSKVIAMLITIGIVAYIVWNSESETDGTVAADRPTCTIEQGRMVCTIEDGTKELVIMAADFEDGDSVQTITVQGSETLEHVEIRVWPALTTFHLIGDFPELESVELIDTPALKYLAAPQSGRAPRLQFPEVAAVDAEHPSLRLVKLPGTAIGAIERLPLANLEELEEIDVRNTAVGNRFMQSLTDISSLHTVRINGCDKISLEARHTFLNFWKPARHPKQSRMSYRYNRRRVSLHDSAPKVYSWPISCRTWFFTSKEIRNPETEEDLNETVDWINSLQIENVRISGCESKLLDQLAAQCPSIRRFLVYSGDYLGFVGSFENLEMLRIFWIDEITAGYESIGELKKLRALSIWGADTDIMPTLSKLGPTLEELDLSVNREMNDLRKLRNLKNLRKLRLGADYETIDDLSFLETMPHLEYLEIDEIGYGADLSPLKKLTKLQTLYISFDGSVKINDLSRLDNLEELRIEATEIADLSGLHDMDSLRILRLDSTISASLSSMEKLPALETLSVGNFTGDDLSLPADMSDLRCLLIRNAENVRDVSPLADCIGLERLRICGSKIETLAPVANLRNLERLELCVGSSANDYTALRNLNELRILCLERPEDPIEHKEKQIIENILPDLNIIRTETSKYSSPYYW